MNIVREETAAELPFPFIHEVISEWKLALPHSKERKELHEKWVDRCEYALKNAHVVQEVHDIYKLSPKSSPVKKRAFRKFLRLLSSLHDFDHYSLLARHDSFQPRPWANEIRRRYEEVCVTELNWADTAEEVWGVLWGLDRLGNPAELQQAALEKLETFCQTELKATTSIKEVRDLSGLAHRLPSENAIKNQIRSRWEEMCLVELDRANTPRELDHLLDDSPWSYSRESNPISVKLETVCKATIDKATTDGREFSFFYYPRSLRTKVMLSVIARSTSPYEVKNILQYASRRSRVLMEGARKLAELTRTASR